MIIRLLLLLAMLVPAINRAGAGGDLPVADGEAQLYQTLGLEQLGLSAEVFRLALKGQKRLESSGRLTNPGILTIADFSQSSTRKRLYVIDLVNRSLLFNTYVAHGRNTGNEFAERFSNVSGSFQSSLGFYVTGPEVTGPSVGLSLLLEGVERGFNDLARQREIVMHGAAYATEEFIRRTGRLGRSFGCPALPPDLIRPVVETIKKGTCLFIYQRDPGYLAQSELLK